MRQPKFMNLDVQTRDIRAGKRANCRSCPIALAFKRWTGAARVYVDFDQIFATVDGHHPAPGARVYSVSRDIEQFMSDFDAGRPVKPFRPVLESA